MNILQRLQQKILLFDGAMGTQLIAAGLKRSECPDQWNLLHPEVVQKIHSAYIDAGSDIVTTNTFGASRNHLKKYDIDSQLDRINAAAVKLAKNCSEKPHFVAGDAGPTGLLFPPMGHASEGEVAEVVTEQVASLLLHNVDLILIETQYDLRETIAALTAVRKLTEIPIATTMTFNRTRRGFFTMTGDSIERCSKLLEENGADILGANCTLTPDTMVELAGLILKSTVLPVLMQPNAGQPRVDGDSIVYDTTPENFADSMLRMADMGIRALGGCCGTTPEYINVLKTNLGAR